jgi:hypothetical protein
LVGGLHTGNKNVCAHELILGETTDFVTGETLVDTIDERARQEIARFLVEEKGYSRDEILVRQPIRLEVNGETGVFMVDFLIKLEGSAFMVIVFGPGSLVTRERPAIAAARLIEKYEVPLSVVTNGRNAEVLETRSGSVMTEGLENIPSRAEAIDRLGAITLEPLPEERLEMERRILYAFEVLAERECDEFTCNLY